jgi:hypothetical protein
MAKEDNKKTVFIILGAIVLIVLLFLIFSGNDAIESDAGTNDEGENSEPITVQGSVKAVVVDNNEDGGATA